MHRGSRFSVYGALGWVLSLACLLAAGVASATVELDEQVLAMPLNRPGGSQNFPSNVSIAINPIDGRLHSVFASPTGAIYHATREASGWEVERLDSLPQLPGGAEFTQIKFDANGDAHVVYVNTRYLPPGANARGPQILYRRWVQGVWTAPEATTPSEIIFSHLMRDLEMGVSGDGSVVAIVASRGPAPAVAQTRTSSGWGPRVPLADVGQASADVGHEGDVVLGLATVAGRGVVLNLSLEEVVSEEQELPGTHDRLRVLAEGSAAGNVHVAWISGTTGLHYWLRHPAFGWHEVPVPAAVSDAALSSSSGNDFKVVLGSNSGLPWFLTSRGTGGEINGALLAVSYASGGLWHTEPLDQALGVDWRDGGFTLGSMLHASMAIDSENRCHVVWQEFAQNPSVGIRLRHVVLSPAPPAALDADPRIPGGPGIAMVVPSILKDGLLRVQIRSGPEVGGTPARLEVLDTAGRRIWSENFVIGTSATMVANLGTRPSGVYFVRLEARGRQVSSRFSILR